MAGVKFQDRDYQHDALAACEGLLSQKTGAVLLVLPTGTGKTAVASRMIKNRAEVGRDRPMFLAPRREIVHQTAAALYRFDMTPGVIMAGHDYTPRRLVQVASVDTLRSWIRRGRVRLNHEDTLFVDEAHRSMSATHQWLMQAYLDAGADVLGLTATPIRSDGVGLGRAFSHLHVGLSMVQAIRQGWLVKPEYRIPYVPDLSGVRTSGGDYSPIELDRIMRQGQLVGDVVDNWVKHAKGRPTLAFAAGVKHSIAIAEAFNSIGVRAAHIDGGTDTEKRDRIIRAFNGGSLDLISNCAVFTEGTDLPTVSCIIDAGPTKSLGKHIQKLGRGLRTLYHPGLPVDTAAERLEAIATSVKPNCMILDHAGNFYRNGRVDRNLEWSLCEGKELVEKARKKTEKAQVAFTCDHCHRVFGGQLYCPSCGTKIEIRGKMADYVEADLVSMTNEEFATIEQRVTAVEQERFYLECLGWAREPKAGRKGAPKVARRKDGFAAAMFKEKFGAWPPYDWSRRRPLAPSLETKSYIRSRQIAGAKARAKAAAQ